MSASALSCKSLGYFQSLLLWKISFFLFEFLCKFTTAQQKSAYNKCKSKIPKDTQQQRQNSLKTLRGLEGQLSQVITLSVSQLTVHSIEGNTKHPPDQVINLFVVTSATFSGEFTTRDLIYQLINSEVHSLEFVLKGL